LEVSKPEKYLELWYYTEGFREAGNKTPATADDTFGVVDTDVGLALQPIKAAKASRNAIRDEQLSWQQIMTGRHNLVATSQAG